ncbi:MAG: Uma2 family endonuclease, partial [Leptolyngbya sp. SIO4C1]|nr:Uma2 family endonuclease [Leptolyngbya sp. SIO4C1]
MIAAKELLPQLTPEEYFVWEARQLENYEYVDGQVYAMGGGSINHGRIAIQFVMLLGTHLDNTGCIMGNSDIKVNIPETNNYTYPDISVTCDERDKANTQYVAYPCLIVEVFS